MQYPLISVIIPVYNVEAYLEPCVNSVTHQTYRNLEVILVDDGSTDRSPKLCDEWAVRDSRIRVIHKKNGGAASARNTGINQARGEYIGFVDSDDYIEENMYEVLYDAIRRSGKKIASCALLRVEPDLSVWPGAGESAEKILSTEESVREILAGRIGISFCSKLYAKEIFSDLRMLEGEVNEEISLTIPMMYKAQGMIHTGMPLYYYRKREGSVTNEYWKSGADTVYNNFNKIKQHLDDYAICGADDVFGLYVSKSSYDVVAIMEKNCHKVDEEIKGYLSKYLGHMRRYWKNYLTCPMIGVKDKIMYVLIIMRMARVVYRLTGRMQDE